MKTDKLKEMYNKYNLTPDDVYKHKHYTIITRQGIDKIQAVEKIYINYEVIRCEKDFAVFKANAKRGDVRIQTFGSAVYGDYKTGNTQQWYIAEMAEKRAMSRAVLKLTGFYELGVFGEDESEDFKKKESEPKKEPTKKTESKVGKKAASTADVTAALTALKKKGQSSREEIVAYFNEKNLEITKRQGKQLMEELAK